MPTAPLPTLRVDTIYLGPSPVVNPSSLMLKVDDVVYGATYDWVYDNYERRIFPVYNAQDNSISLVSIGYAHGDNMPTTTLSNVEVLAIA